MILYDNNFDKFFIHTHSIGTVKFMVHVIYFKLLTFTIKNDEQITRSN